MSTVSIQLEAKKKKIDLLKSKIVYETFGPVENPTLPQTFGKEGSFRRPSVRRRP